ncbi:signal recognition particle-docking protein FtsY [Alkaliphilus metalliredigens QYMF]|uniref:Signal recognition particle receptor FtsY n=1 Tax=Alkaliphilus metalliredigens (strain QYMF) TaxID=293826 RepID=A6TRT2_ALKMQ|nr:signal recognition particle-docking protein FtsY [Alkaliphilus metalliredigens]ABR48900.1 signal recognition particle-docking protein FtsY [Alkaliphilus metalliredigens QYMF]
MFKKFFNRLIKQEKTEDSAVDKDVESEDLERDQEEVEDIIETEEVEIEEELKVDKESECIDVKNEAEDQIKKQLDESNKQMEDVSLTLLENPEHLDETAEAEMEEAIQVQNKEGEGPLSLFKRLKEGLSKTKQGITGKVDELLKSYKKIDEALFEELEEILITSDIGVKTTMEIIDGLRDKIKEKKVSEPEQVKELLKEALIEILQRLPDAQVNIEPGPAIVLVVGVNGVGKTTSIGKMAHRFKQDGKKVLLAAGDTFRAAASEQLEIWAQRVGVEVVKHQEGSDPAAVIFDAIQAAKARKVDVLICDTAGRLHNKKNLMNELGKVFKVVDREYGEATKEVLLVLDATTGQNAIQQAKTFKEVANITGLILTKLDGTAKGGVVIGISQELTIPVKLIGVGEKMEDLQQFNATDFVKALFGEEA